MNVELKILTRNDSTALPRVLRIVDRQGLSLKKLVLQPGEDVKTLEIYVSLDCLEMPVRLIKLLQKQILVFDVEVCQETVSLAV